MNRGAIRNNRTRFAFITIFMLVLLGAVAALTGGTAVGNVSNA